MNEWMQPIYLIEDVINKVDRFIHDTEPINYYFTLRPLIWLYEALKYMHLI